MGSAQSDSNQYDQTADPLFVSPSFISSYSSSIEADVQHSEAPLFDFPKRTYDDEDEVKTNAEIVELDIENKITRRLHEIEVDAMKRKIEELSSKIEQ